MYLRKICWFCGMWHNVRASNNSKKTFWHAMRWASTHLLRDATLSQHKIFHNPHALLGHGYKIALAGLVRLITQILKTSWKVLMNLKVRCWVIFFDSYSCFEKSDSSSCSGAHWKVTLRKLWTKNRIICCYQLRL